MQNIKIMSTETTNVTENQNVELVDEYNYLRHIMKIGIENHTSNG